MSNVAISSPSIRQTIGAEIDAHFSNEVAANLGEITPQFIEQAFRSTTWLLCRYSSRMEPPGVTKRIVGALAQPFVSFGQFHKNLIGFEPLFAKVAKMIVRCCRHHPPVAAHVHIILSDHDARKVAKKSGQRNKMRTSDYFFGATSADYLGVEITEQHKEKLDQLNMQLAAQNLFAKIDVLRVANQSWVQGGGAFWGWVVKGFDKPVITLT